MYIGMDKGREDKTVFFLRQSYQAEHGGWCSRDLFCLGPDPEKYIEYVDERAFYISPEVEEKLGSQGVNYEYSELEEIFWPFIDPYIRQTIDAFGGLHGREYKRHKRYSRDELVRMQEGIHLFDKRRFIFLKYLQIDTDSLLSRPLPFLNRLLDKSRDEIESIFDMMELDLKPWEMKGYLYAIFGLPERFSPRLSRFIPDVQDQDIMDEFFLDELCSLNRDSTYLDQGARPTGTAWLHPYLKKYLFQYFDYVFRGPRPGRSFQENQNRAWHPSANDSDEHHLKVMGLDKDRFNNMSEEDFVRFFRKMAQKLHPDHGGDHEDFIRFQQAFEYLMVKKKWW
ncbi:MAG: hypothetical protein DSZ23_02795 [Thermodesulfatator sp.]|nr:MAG: hypothetical protein DSZ23_02795 [Thermodesulfatator sp.]